jgi:hypothetical protein
VKTLLDWAGLWRFTCAKMALVTLLIQSFVLIVAILLYIQHLYVTEQGAAADLVLRKMFSAVN